MACLMRATYCGQRSGRWLPDRACDMIGEGDEYRNTQRRYGPSAIISGVQGVIRGHVRLLRHRGTSGR